MLEIVKTTPQSDVQAEAFNAAERAAAAFSLTDAGNARRLVSQHGAELRWVSQFGNWYIWNGIRWQPDVDGEIMRRAKATARSIFLEAGQPGLSKQEALDLARHAVTTESLRSLKAMVELSKSELLESDL